MTGIFMRTITFWIVMSLTFLGGFAQAKNGSIVDQDEKIVFDKDNYLVFEDVGRISTERTLHFGAGVRLHAMRDGKAAAYDLTELSKSPTRALSSRVIEIRYRDKNRVWILSELSHVLSGAILYNLATRQVEWHVWGAYMKISPNARHLAFTVPRGYKHHCPAVFVDTLMAYPKIEPGFTDPKAYTPQKENGKEWNTFVSFDKAMKTVVSDIQWLNNGEIEFTVGPAEDDTGKAPQETVRVSGLEDLQKPEAMKASIRPVDAKK